MTELAIVAWLAAAAALYGVRWLVRWIYGPL